MQTVQRRWCTVLLAALRAGAGGNVSCLQIRAEMKHSTLPTAPALVRCLRIVRYGAYLFAVRRLFMRTGMHCGRVASLCFFFRCCCAMRSVGARWENILFYRIEKGFLLFCRVQHPRSNPALRAAAAEGGALCSALLHLLPCKMKPSTIIKKMRTVLHIS